MEGCRTRWPVPGAFFAGDGPPSEGRAGQPEAAGVLLGDVEGVTAPGQGVGGSLGASVGENGEHKGLSVPKGVAVIPGSREPFGGYGPALRAGSDLKNV